MRNTFLHVQPFLQWINEEKTTFFISEGTNMRNKIHSISFNPYNFLGSILMCVISFSFFNVFLRNLDISGTILRNRSLIELYWYIYIYIYSLSQIKKPKRSNTRSIRWKGVVWIISQTHVFLFQNIRDIVEAK